MSEAMPRRRSWLWLQGLACGAALSVATAPALLVAVLLAPGLAAYMAERTPAKPTSEPMLVLGAATVFAPLRDLWEHGHTLGACLDMLANPTHIALSWSVAAGAWLMGQVGVLGAWQISQMTARHRTEALRREREALVAEWGTLDPQKAAAPRG